MLEKTSLKPIGDNIDDRMSARLQYSVVERLEHRTCTFWDAEEDDFTSLDSSATTEGEIDEDICVAFED
jgi:hypothetical protein